MSLLSMPLLIINMGGEMVYILEQRLTAQNITSTKSKRVLQDVIKTMFSDTFIGELFKPQEVYSRHSTRGIFDRLAHSSIMRLSQTSMDKLHDLMSMGFKHQALNISHSRQLLQVTKNHTNFMRTVIEDPDITALVANVEKRIEEIYMGLSDGDWHLLHNTVLSYFQDRRIKVSLFLQDQVQLTSGQFVFFPSGVLPQTLSVKPGFMRVKDSSGAVKSEQSLFELPAGWEMYSETSNAKCSLGMNLYEKKNKKSPPVEEKKEDVTTMSPPATESPAKLKATEELNLLAAMINPVPVKKGETMHLALFNESEDSTETSIFDTCIVSAGGDDVTALNPHLKNVASTFEADDQQEEDSNDILDMLDEVGI